MARYVLRTRDPDTRVGWIPHGTSLLELTGRFLKAGYADDFVCVVQYAEDAQRIERALKSGFERYGLEIHPDKSCVFSNIIIKQEVYVE